MIKRFYDPDKLKIEVNEILTPQEIFEYYHYPLKHGSTYINTRGLDGKDNNLTIRKIGNEWLWKDWSRVAGKNTGKGIGSAYDLLWEFNPNSGYPEIAEIAETISGREIKKSLSNMDNDSEEYGKLNSFIIRSNDNIFKPENKQYLEYLLNRGYTIDYIKDRKIGFNSYLDKRNNVQLFQIIFPYFNIFGDVRSFKVRNLELYPDKNISIPKYKKDSYFSVKGTYETIPYNLDQAIGKKNIVLVEGLVDSDIISIYSDFGTICLDGNGLGSKAWEDSIFPILDEPIKHNSSTKPKVTLIFDNDRTGKDFYIANSKRLLDHGIYNFDVCIVPKHDGLSVNDSYELHFKDTDKEDHTYKDINDYYIKNKSLNGIFDTRMNGLVYLGLAFKLSGDIEEFEKILIKHSRFIKSTAKINEIIRGLNESKLFDEEETKHFRNLMNNVPADPEIGKELKSKYNLYYHDSLGFMMFDKIWKPLSEGYLTKLINKTYGKFASGTRVSPLKTYLKGECSEEYLIEFNKSEVMIFNNGTLDLKTGEFRKDYFSSMDYMTNITTYNYDPEAKCDKWIDFLYDVCEVKDNPEETEKKLKTLQEFAGYILFPNYPHHTALILSGNGSNGKSVFIDILEAVFHSKYNKAVTHVDVSEISKPFHAIHLKDSLLNISNETRTSLMGSEEKLKKLFAGEALQDSYKNKDNIEFKSRAKHIIAANNDILPKDKSNGFVRRLLFVKFLNNFSDNPKAGEKKKNIELTEELYKEIPGIFNWVYEGYKRLKLNKKFTLTDEHLNALEDIKDDINTVRQFLKDDRNNFDHMVKMCNLGNKIVLSNLMYSRYVDFCKDGNYNPVSKRVFGKELKRTLEDFSITFKCARVGGGTGYWDMKVPPEWYEENFGLKRSHLKEVGNNISDSRGFLINENNEIDKDFIEIEA